LEGDASKKGVYQERRSRQAADNSDQPPARQSTPVRLAGPTLGHKIGYVCLVANIKYFLRDKSRVMRVSVETIEDDFARFWDWIGAEGDRAAALAERLFGARLYS